MKNKEIKIETLKKNYKKHFIIGVAATCIIGSILTFKLTHSKYQITKDIDIGTETINNFSSNFQSIAVKISDDGENYSDTNTLPTSGYTLNTSKSTCSNGTIPGWDAANSRFYAYNLTKSGTSCYLYFDKINGITIDDIIASSNAKSEVPNFSQVATTDEGVYSTSDEMYSGTTYYWRGAATTSHVIFANKCWKIVRINGDKTMRLIYNGSTNNNDGKTCANFGSGAVVYSSTTSDRYYATSDGLHNNASYVGWTYSLGSQRTLSGTDSNAKYQTQKWYDNNIGNNETYSAKVADGKFCNDRDTEAGGLSGWSATGSAFNYAGYKRLSTNKTPTFNCPSGDVYILKVGAITADEVVFAGGVYGSSNQSYYMYTGQYYWTMSPYSWDSGSASVFSVDSDGYLGWYNVYYTFGLRPVINLRSDVTFSSGNGTILNPYTVS